PLPCSLTPSSSGSPSKLLPAQHRFNQLLRGRDASLPYSAPCTRSLSLKLVHISPGGPRGATPRFRVLGRPPATFINCLKFDGRVSDKSGTVQQKFNQALISPSEGHYCCVFTTRFKAIPDIDQQQNAKRI